MRLVRRHEDDVVGHRLPERLSLERNDIESLLDGHVGQLRGDPAGGEVRVKNDRDPGKFRDSVEDGLGVVGHLQIDRSMRKRLQRRRSRHQLGFFFFGRGCLRRSGGRIFRGNRVERGLGFLLGDGARGINQHGLLKFGDGHLQIALVAELLTLPYVVLAGFKAHAVELKLVFGVGRIGLERAVVMHQGCIVIVNGLGFFPLVVVLIPIVATGEPKHSARERRNCNVPFGHPGTPIGSEPRRHAGASFTIGHFHAHSRNDDLPG